MSNSLAETAAPVGLVVNQQSIPLQGVRVEASIQDFCSRVILTQRYINTESHPVEAVYVFPLDEAAAVSGFAAIVDGIEIMGEVKQRDEAFETYDDALASGHGAYLLDQEKPDVFTASIGNLPPGKEVLVKLTYVTELAPEDDGLRFVLPSTVSPRYAPAEDQIAVGRSPAEAVNPPLAWSVPYGLELSVAIEMAGALRSVESPSHPIALELHGTKAMVRLGERTSAMDRDFVLLVRVDEPERPRAWIEETSDGETVAMVAFQPKLNTEQAPCELIFLVDRSGSMMGSSIEQARNALQLCMRSLSEHTRFNIVGFGSSYESLFPESLPYNEETLAKASDHIRSLQADLGGTEILSPLESVLSAPPSAELARQLFILTDGQVSNTEAVIARIRKHSDTTRVFTFGIGAGASHHLVRGMARAGEGAAEFISPGERMEGKVMRQLKRALVPALTQVQIDWGSLKNVKQAPYRVPPAFADGRVLAYGVFQKAPKSGATEIVLRAKSPEGDVAFSVPLSFEDKKYGNLIATLAARTLLRDLEEGASALHERGSLQRRLGKDRVKEEAVRLGVRYGLASRWTSFVAVEKREAPVEGESELRRIPLALTKGWGGSDELTSMVSVASFGAAGGAPAAAFAPAAFEEAMSMDLGASEDGVTLDHLDDGAAVAFSPSFEQSQPSASSTAKRPFDDLVLLQRADGSWQLDEVFADAIGQTLLELEKSFPACIGDRGEARRAWATALAIEWLEVNASDWRDEWDLLRAKAQAWLERCEAKPSSGEEWSAMASRDSR